ncbi:hypothetical protein [Nostoc sp.]|uniref:hypothetical protein n=1 Tax=Nostoc sp. TaxID=1180 RepID=UPI002FFA068B
MLKEFLQLLATEIGFKPLSKAKSWAEIRKQLGQYLLFNEFALDLPCKRTLRLVESGGELIPVLGERKLEESKHRMRLLQEKYGDRFKDIEPEDIFSKKVNALGKQLASVNLLVVRTKDPDRIAESIGNMKARKYLSDVVGEMVNIIRRLSTIGFTHFVIGADHGHVLIDEIPLGDVIPKPGGEWLKTKRRNLLGQFISGESSSVVIFKTEQVGIQGDA